MNSEVCGRLSLTFPATCVSNSFSAVVVARQDDDGENVGNQERKSKNEGKDDEPTAGR